MNVTNIREKHPSTQKAYMGLKVATNLGTGAASDVIAAPSAGYCINIIDSHTSIGIATKATTLYYTIVPV